MVVNFELWWGGRRRQRERFTWALDVDWPAVPRQGDELDVDELTLLQGRPMTIRHVEWRQDSILVRLVDIWTDDEKDGSRTVADLRRFVTEHAGSHGYDAKNDEWINSDDGVGLIVRVLEAIEPWMLYEILLRLFPKVRSGLYAYFYVCGWMFVLLLGLAFLPLDGWWLLPVLAAVVWRTVDLVRWYLDLFLDRAHSHLSSSERNLVMAILNLGELVVIGAILFRASEVAAHKRPALFDSFLLVTQLDAPHVGDFVQALSVVAVEGTALLLLLGGISALIAEIQEKLVTTGVWRDERRYRDEKV